MNRPYIDALNRPAEADSLPLRKNDTVIGIIGKTQGGQQRQQSPADRHQNQSQQSLPAGLAASPSGDW